MDDSVRADDVVGFDNPSRADDFLVDWNQFAGGVAAEAGVVN